LALKWSDIDATARTARFTADTDKCGRHRTKPLHSQVLKLMLACRHADDELVFPWSHGKHRWYAEWHELQLAAHIPNAEHIKLHDLKRFAGTQYAATASPWVVQKMLDHASIETSRFYINPIEACRQAVEQFPLPQEFFQ
jgi:integrase